MPSYPMMNKPPVIILCGGLGSRLHEETEFRPKPMLEIGGRPILWHIMKLYAAHGFREFILCLGYKGDLIKDFFLNYQAYQTDFTVHPGNSKQIEYHNHNGTPEDWKITLAETGLTAQTGARVHRAGRYVQGDTFCLTYGDGLGDIDITALLKFHQTHGKIATVTGVRPPGRFGELEAEGSGKVLQFNEKPQNTQGMINGGFFVFKREFLNRLQDQDDLVLETEPLQRLAREGELMAYPHQGFWQPMDTYREFKMLNEIWSTGKAPWKVWP